MSKNPQQKKPGKNQRPPIENRDTATNPGRKERPEKPLVKDDVERLKSYDQLPRRDPSGARGQRDRQGKTDNQKTKR